MKIILYTTHCPKCNILMTKLNDKQISYTICEDIETMTTLGFDTVPVLEVEGEYMEFKAAVDWVNNY